MYCHASVWENTKSVSKPWYSHFISFKYGNQMGSVYDMSNGKSVSKQPNIFLEETWKKRSYLSESKVETIQRFGFGLPPRGLVHWLMMSGSSHDKAGHMTWGPSMVEGFTWSLLLLREGPWRWMCKASCILRLTCLKVLSSRHKILVWLKGNQWPVSSMG